MNILAASVYWVIVVLWLGVIVVLGVAFTRNPQRFRSVRLLLAVVAIDTVRNIIENIYFGLYFGSQYGLFPASVGNTLGIPYLLLLPKLLNIMAASAVGGLLIFRWLPRMMKERDETASTLHQAEWNFQLLVDGVSEYALYLIDPQGRVVSWNSGAERIKGYKAEEILGKSVETFYPVDDRGTGLLEEALRTAAACGRFETKAWRVKKDGTRFWANVVIDAIRNVNGSLVGFAKITKDITESQRAEERLIQLAHFDQLTGLPNRTSMLSDLKSIVSTEPVAAIIGMIDLDGFKTINDTYGHTVGDLILAEVADRAREVLGDEGKFYRLGGDEFVIIIPKCRDPLVATQIVNPLLRRIEDPFEVEGRHVFLAASAGIAIAPTDGAAVDELIAYADLALYEAKEEGGRKCKLFVPTMRAKVHARNELNAELRRACADREFVLHYQPQIRLSDGAVVGAEALLRWKHPSRGLLSPAVFIDALAESPFALEIGNWILHSACMTAAEWRRKGIGDVRVGINLFPVQFHDGALLTEVESALRESGLPAEGLELEITENIALGHDEFIMATLHSLRNEGVGLAFDDFGTGYASLSYLTKYPLTRVKIDRSFVRNITKKCPPEATAIVRSIIVMSHNLGFEVIAEGVETPYQANFLQAKRCDEAQGFFYSKALSAAEFESFCLNYLADSRTQKAS